MPELGWTVGQSYQYEWRGTQQITIKETTNQINQIDLTATVAVDVLSACKRQLRVRFYCFYALRLVIAGW